MKMFKMTTGGGQALLRNKQSAVKRALLYILTPIFCVGLCLGTVFSFSNRDNKVSASADAAAAPASILNLNGELKTALKGGQKENVYFGTNNGSTVKWRVLDTGDNNKYGSGMLLWADKQVGDCKYNLRTNAEYAFWGTSYIRSKLNGPSAPYYPTIGGGIATVPDEDSWYSKLFKPYEKSSVVKVSYTTDDWGFDNSSWLADHKFAYKDIVADNWVNGKYKESALGTSFGLYATVSDGNGVQERTNDWLFLLDYYDINNVSYGFVDSDGKTYAQKVSTGWDAATSDFYPGDFPGTGQSIDPTRIADYLKFTDTKSFYWLRPAGRVYEGESAGLMVSSGGNVTRGVDSWGVRPAFNLETNNVVYATAASLNSMGSTLSSVNTAAANDDGKPAYKLYIKGESYEANTTSAKSYMAVNNSTITVAYNNPANISSGNLVLLLSKADGSVEYQAERSVSGVVSGLNTVTFTLPVSVTYSDYNVSMLYTSEYDGSSSETVHCLYKLDSLLNTPFEFSTEYNNSLKWITNLESAQRPSWYNEKLHGNSAFVSVQSIVYTDNIGAHTNETVQTSDVKAAGTYAVTLHLAEGLKWSTGDSDDKTFDLVVDKADPTVTATVGINNIYVTNGFPKNGDGTANVTNTAAGGTPGTFTWNVGQTPSTSTPTYTCKFTPTDINNFNTKDDCPVSVTFVEDEVTGVTASVAVDGTGTDKLYTSNTLDKLKAAPFSLTVKLVHASGYQEEASDYTIKVLNDGVLQDYFHAGTNTVQVESNGYDCSFTVEVTAAEIDSIKDVDFNQNGRTIYPNTPLDSIEDLFTVRGYWNYNITKFETLDKDNFKLDGTLVPGTGTSTLFVVYTKGGAEQRYPIPAGVLNKITVDYLTYDMDGVELTGEKTVTYDGDSHALTLTGTLPDGVTAGNITYTKQGGTPTTTAPTDAGTYTVKVSFTGDTVNYKPINDVTATLTINKATVTGIVFEDAVKPEITGTTYTLEATGYPLWVNVTYSVTDKDKNPLTGISFSAAGTYNFTATFTIDAAHVNNYEAINPITKTLTISDKPPVDGADDIVVEATITVTYTGSPVDYSAKNVPDSVTPSYTIVKKDDASFSGTDIINVGVYTVTVSFQTPADKAPIASKTCVVTVVKATVNMDGVEFADRTVTGNGKPHKVEATNLPDGVTVEYEYGGKKQTTPFEFVDVDKYTVKAHFTYVDENNYEPIDFKEMTLTVSDAVVESISAKVEDGAKFDINGTLDDVKAKLTATAHFNNGTTEQVKAEDLAITCATLRDGGLLEVGTQIITVTYNDGTQDFTTTVQIEVARAKVALPVYSGSLRYTGDVLKPAVSDFTGFDGALMAFVESKTVAGLNVGAYKAVFALKDSERYEWATTTTYKKAVFAAVAYEEVVLEDYEAAVDWNLARARITATKANGKLPIFASESYTGSFAEIVGLKYYTDETCAEEIPADELAYSTKYFVKAELLDTANFELDETAMTLSKTAFEYTTPEKQLTVWETIVKFLSANWLWIVIAVVALILLITLIALAVRAAKRKREREEQRLAKEERKEEERRLREEERRREEREERMARLSQPQMMMPQMMPQMPQMPQGQPQYAPQAPAAGGGTVTEAQFMQMQSEIATLKAEATLRAEAALRAEQQIAQTKSDLQYASIMARLGGEQFVQGGISLDKLTELIRTEVNNAFESREKKAAAPTAPETSAATPVATQVPPDAVMTTVTTTKIDTTKKPAQPLQASAPAPATRTVVRNFVAPMPVDDGRVFDVGGFYTPADPVDLGMNDEENKD
ncbi:MAG: hypothetical protein K2O44_06670 [Clostridia bacterium]|nr:hypothetical protein [Clostridia bacterium]